ncbi:hypothetical protein [Nocardiopsis baichengensis]|uniref:hypothetical protein n=1 Tax=Nocardiopsis baichengensis TaxID=280240 RepID=UPI000345B208|nr:hypothetical protein [Nocardiopsis baichengensis]
MSRRNEREGAMGTGRDEAELRAMEARLRAEDPGCAERIDACAHRLAAQERAAAGPGPQSPQSPQSPAQSTEPVPRTGVALICGAFAFALLMLVLVPLLVRSG